METVTLKISKESHDFLQDLAKEIWTQNNRGTAKPYFLVIQSKKWRLVPPGYGHGETKYSKVCQENDPREYESEEEYLKDKLEEFHTEHEPPEPLEEDEINDPECVADYEKELTKYNTLLARETEKLKDKYERLEDFEQEEYEEEDNCFFTDKAFKEHVAQNGHNLRRGNHGYYTYMKYAYRNPEFASLFRFFFELYAQQNPGVEANSKMEQEVLAEMALNKFNGPTELPQDSLNEKESSDESTGLPLSPVPIPGL